MRISDWSSDVCSSDLAPAHFRIGIVRIHQHRHRAAVRMRHPVIDDHVRSGDRRDDIESRTIARPYDHALHADFLVLGVAAGVAPVPDAAPRAPGSAHLSTPAPNPHPLRPPLLAPHPPPPPPP